MYVVIAETPGHAGEGAAFRCFDDDVGRAPSSLTTMEWLPIFYPSSEIKELALEFTTSVSSSASWTLVAVTRLVTVIDSRPAMARRVPVVASPRRAVGVRRRTDGVSMTTHGHPRAGEFVRQPQDTAHANRDRARCLPRNANDRARLAAASFPPTRLRLEGTNRLRLRLPSKAKD